MHVDYEKMMEMVHEIMFDIFKKIEKETPMQMKLQDVGYPHIPEGVGCYSFKPSIQHNLTTVLCEHFGKDNTLSIIGKYQAVKMAVVSSTAQQLCLESLEDVQRSEFVAFLDHYSQFCLKLEQQMEKSVASHTAKDTSKTTQRRTP